MILIAIQCIVWPWETLRLIVDVIRADKLIFNQGPKHQTCDHQKIEVERERVIKELPRSFAGEFILLMIQVMAMMMNVAPKEASPNPI